MQLLHFFYNHVILAECLRHFSLPPNFMDYNSNLITRQVETILIKYLLCLCQWEIIYNGGGVGRGTCAASDVKFWVYDVLQVNTCLYWAATLLLESYNGGKPLAHSKAYWFWVCLLSACLFSGLPNLANTAPAMLSRLYIGESNRWLKFI